MVGTFCLVMGVFAALFVLIIERYKTRVYRDMKIAVETDTYLLLKERFTKDAVDQTYLNANIGLVTCLARISIIKQILNEEEERASVKRKILKTQLHESMETLNVTVTQIVENELKMA